MPQLLTLQIGLTESLYNTPNVIAKGQDMLLDLWGREDTPANRAWVWSGWVSNYHVVANPSIKVYIYRATIQQMKAELKNTFSSTEIEKYKAWFSATPQAKISISRDPDDALIMWGIERDPDPIEP